MKTVKTIYFSKLFILLTLALFAFSCSDNSTGTDDEELVPELEGMYVYGSNTTASSANDTEAKMSPAVLDPGQGAGVSSMEDVYGKFMYIGASSTIEFTLVEGEEGTTYGAPGGGSLDSASTIGNSPIQDEVIHGTLTADSDPISISEEGLYYTYVDARDTENMLFIIMPVKPDVIGDATPGSWETGTDLSATHVSMDSAVYEISDVELTGATGYKYRFNKGWHVYQGPEVVTLSSLGVESYADAWEDSTGNYDIGFYLENIPNHRSGLFDVRLKFNAESGEWSETKVKTADVFPDYSDVEYGWFGNAFYLEDGTTEGSWSQIRHIKTPTKDGNLYHWTWTMELIEGRSFVLRENAEEGAWITYGGAAKTGSAFENEDIVKEEGQDNYFVNTGGTYEVTFTIDAENAGRILNIVPAE